MIKNAKLLGYCFYMNTNIQGDFQIGISVSLRSSIRSPVLQRHKISQQIQSKRDTKVSLPTKVIIYSTFLSIYLFYFIFYFHPCKTLPTVKPWAILKISTSKRYILMVNLKTHEDPLGTLHEVCLLFYLFVCYEIFKLQLDECPKVHFIF